MRTINNPLSTSRETTTETTSDRLETDVGVGELQPIENNVGDYITNNIGNIITIQILQRTKWIY